MRSAESVAEKEKQANINVRLHGKKANTIS
jgi:hypothetical protein